MSKGSPAAQKRARDKFTKAHPYRKWLDSVKHRASRKGLEFDLTVDDLQIPDFCPVFPTIQLAKIRSNAKQDVNSATVDRVNNAKGYIKSNCQIISWRANQLKRNASPEELLAIAKYVMPLISITVENLRVVQ